MPDYPGRTQLLREFVRVVWEGRDVSALPTFWTADCVNHAGPETGRVGLDALRAYHEGFFTGFLLVFSHPAIEFVQQVAEGDRVVSQMAFRATHTGPLFGTPPTGTVVSLAPIRIDRIEGRSLSTGRWRTRPASCSNSNRLRAVSGCL